MRVFNIYLLKNLAKISTAVTLTLSAVIVLTQSMRFLELIIEAGAGAGTFWTLTFLALPRFLEILMPLSVMIATVFVYSRLAENSEITIMRSSGFSPLRIAQPAIILSVIVTMFLLFITLWGAPKSLASLQQMRQVVKSEFSALLLRKGVFNRIGRDFTVYVQGRSEDGTLSGVVIHDQGRKTGSAPSTILARRGQILDEGDVQRVIVYEGSRQSYDFEKNVLQRLDFDRYTVELPLQSDVVARWRSPDERTVFELLNPDTEVERDVESQWEFILELHRRFTAPVLTVSFVFIGAAGLILGPSSRRGQGRRLSFVIVSCLLLQGLFIAAYNIARQHMLGVVLMYAVVVLPALFALYVLSGAGESWRRQALYTARQGDKKNA